jgi:uncharacterized protein YqjF (DUF2071 family)
MAQTWYDLLFAHWPVPVEVLRPLIPPGLELDTYEGRAWLGVVPFGMRDIYLRRLPLRTPLYSRFLELNVRTYVTAGSSDGKAGVWFFSLDAANGLAVAAARASVRLPYFPARMERGEGWYKSERTLGRADFEARFSVGVEQGTAAKGSLEEFLVERYQLFSTALGPVLWRVPVRHAPWKLFAVEIAQVRESLSAAAGVQPLGRPDFGQWSPGVAVEFEHPRPA